MEINLDNINDDFIKEHLFDTLGRLNGEYKYLLYEQKIINYLINRFSDCNNVEEAARRIYKNIEIVPLCPVCGNKCKYKGGSKVYEETCGSIVCKNTYAYSKHLETFKSNHNGLTNSFQFPEVKEKIKKTMLEKYGVEYSGQIEEKKIKSKQTWIKKYGVDNPAKSDIVKEKSKNTCLEKYGVEYSFQSENNKEKSKQTLLSRYGVECMLYIKEIRDKGLKECRSNEAKEKAKQTCIKKYGVYPFTKSDIYKEIVSDKTKQINKQYKEYITKKKNHTFNTSSKETKSYNLILEKFNDVISQYKSDKYPFLCDFYIPSLDLYIECNYHWTHGGHPYNDNTDDKIIVNKWKSKNTSYYNNAIRTWTIRDVKKRNTAKENNLNYLEFFTILELENWLNCYGK